MPRRARKKLTTPKKLTTSAPSGSKFRNSAYYFFVILIFGYSLLHGWYRKGMDHWQSFAGGHRVAVSSPAWDRVPPRPAKYVTDLTGLLDGDRAARLNETLAAFERQTSNQIVVYVAPSIPYDTTLEDVASESFKAWGIGQKGRDNGVLFLVFTGDRKMRIEVGYGLEGVLTDAKAKRITSTVVKPFFQRQAYTEGIEAGARAIVDVVRGEGLEGSGRTFAESAGLVGIAAKGYALSFIGWLLMMLLLGSGMAVTGMTLSFLQLQLGLPDPFAGGGSSGSWSGGSSSSGSSYSSSSSSSSSDFSGGGGSSGGGGASDSW